MVAPTHVGVCLERLVAEIKCEVVARINELRNCGAIVHISVTFLVCPIRISPLDVEAASADVVLPDAIWAAAPSYFSIVGLETRSVHVDERPGVRPRARSGCFAKRAASKRVPGAGWRFGIPPVAVSGSLFVPLCGGGCGASADARAGVAAAAVVRTAAAIAKLRILMEISFVR